MRPSALQRLVRAALGVGLLGTGVAIGLAIATRLELPVPVAAGPATPAPEPRTAEGLESAFVAAAERVSPAVVNIATERTVVQQPFGGDPMLDDWMRQFFAIQPYRYKTRSLGSGSIVTADGYILTNAHVVADADVVRIFLLSGEEYTARKIGSDDRTDLAVVKIDATKKLPTVPLGDSDLIRVGQWALAIGNPFGLTHTVTAGVISARGRSHLAGIGENRYQNFIQTDASINPGNSGGPLANLRGEVVGVNTMIYSQSGGSVGIGFAVPVNMAKRVIADLTEKGRVVRPQLGVRIEEGVPGVKGLRIADVSPGSSADRAGVRAGDVLVEVNGRPVTRAADLSNAILDKSVGESVPLRVLRDGQSLALTVKLAEPLAGAGDDARSWLGLVVAPLTEAARAQHGVLSAEGALVTRVLAGSSAEAAGLAAGDAVLAVARMRVRSVAEYEKATRRVPSEEGAVLLVERRGERGYVVLPPGR